MEFGTRARRLAAGWTVVLLLAACGGGGDAPLTFTGWSGTAGGNRDLTAVVLPNGTYYLLYAAAGDPATVGGVVQGTATLDKGSFSSADALDFSAEGAGIRASGVAASYDPAGSFQGTVTPTAGGTALDFQATQPRTNWVPAGLPALVGSYGGTAGFALGVRQAVFTVTASGAVSSSINGCAITGTAAPRSDGDAYDLTLTFGPSPCALPGLAFAGIAFLRPDNGRLYAAARNTATRQSVIFNGARQ